MTVQIRVCPICEHRQARSDPTRHSCASVLHERLRLVRGELAVARVQLAAVADSLGHPDPVRGASVRMAELGAARRSTAVAYDRGRRIGARMMLVLLHADARRRGLLSMWVLNRAFMRISYAIRGLRAPGLLASSESQA